MNGLKSVAHVCIKTPDLVRTLERPCITSAWRRTTWKRCADGSRQFWVADPNGTRFEFHEYTEHSAQLGPPGRAVEVNW